MTTEIHQKQLQYVCEKFGLQSRGFYKNIRDLVDDKDLYVVHNIGIIPDAFTLRYDKDTGSPEIVCYEIENYNQFRAFKENKYVNFWFYLDCDEIFLTLYLVDRFGNTIKEYNDEFKNLLSDNKERKK